MEAADLPRRALALCRSFSESDPFMLEDGEDRIRGGYRGNCARLTAVKANYEPENFFRVNQNIRPAA